MSDRIVRSVVREGGVESWEVSQWSQTGIEPALSGLCKLEQSYQGCHYVHRVKYYLSGIRGPWNWEIWIHKF